MTGEIALLVLAWIVWGSIHSLLVGRAARAAAARVLRVSGRAYRLLYNGIALITLVAVIRYERSIDGPVVFDWFGASRVVSPVLLAVAIFAFVAGARVYDLWVFLGLRAQPPAADGALPGLDRRGILGIVRHPWYAGTLCALWAGDKNAAGLASAVALSAYVVVGTLIEERRLLTEFGESYARYRREVPMYLPRVRFPRRSGSISSGKSG